MVKESQKGKPGRKPGTDNKVPVTIYVEESILSKLGNGFLITGKDKARHVALNAVYATAGAKK